jgi:hypothetical protein
MGGRRGFAVTGGWLPGPASAVPSGQTRMPVATMNAWIFIGTTINMNVYFLHFSICTLPLLCGKN